MADRRRRRVQFDKPGGMAELYRPPENTAELVQEMRVDPRGAWTTVGGYRTIIHYESGEGSPFAGAGSVESIYWWAQHSGGRQWLMWEFGDPDDGDNFNLVAFRPANNSWVMIDRNRKRVRGPWQKTQYQVVAGWLYFINGIDAPKRWDGRGYHAAKVTSCEDADCLVRPGFDRAPPPPELGSPVVGDSYFFRDPGDGVQPDPNVGKFLGLDAALSAQTRGVGTDVIAGDSDWLYGYAVTWINDLGMESPPSAVKFIRGENTQAAGVPGRRYVQVLVDDAPKHVRGIRIWRTRNLIFEGPNEFATLWLAQTAEGGIGFTWADGTPDNELGAPLDQENLGLWPDEVKYIVSFKGTLFLADDSNVYYSAAALIEQFPTNNVFPLGDATSGECRGMRATKNAIVVFRQRAIHLIKGDPRQGFYMETLATHIGNEAPNAVVEIPNVGLTFMNSAGIHVLMGALENTGTPTKVIHLSTGIQDTWQKRVMKGYLMSAVAEVYEKDKEVWFQVPGDGDERPTLGLVYHYEKGWWSLRTGWPINCMAVSADYRAHMFFGSFNTVSHPGVHVYTPGYNTKGFDAITSIYASSPIAFGSVWARTRALWVQPYLLTRGDRTAVVSYKVDRHDDYQSAGNNAKVQDDIENTRARWGVAVWGDTWTDYVPTVVRYDIEPESTLELQWRVVSARMTLISVMIGLQAGDPLDIQKATDVFGSVI